jgi:AraC family transcriptional regulator of adaptative response/methylated-DNA-[protein]-cysteine methyltransferase
MRMNGKSGAPGASIRYASRATALGEVLVARSGRGVCAILLGGSRRAVAREARKRFPGARPDGADPELTAALADAIRLVERPSSGFRSDLDLRGTPFQLGVWRALRDVPAGATTTYAALAARLRAPRSARAIGAACAANPLAVAVPCHRVLRKDGSLSGYRWGIRRKAELLRREADAQVFETEPAA